MHLALPTTLITLAASFLLSPHALLAQRAQAFKPEVRQYISVDAPVVALIHVRVIDGTGAPPKNDQTVVISGTVTPPGPNGGAAEFRNPFVPPREQTHIPIKEMAVVG